jgi:hypothetical protein
MISSRVYRAIRYLVQECVYSILAYTVKRGSLTISAHPFDRIVVPSMNAQPFQLTYMTDIKTLHQQPIASEKNTIGEFT